jgi:hypothetical protein
VPVERDSQRRGAGALLGNGDGRRRAEPDADGELLEQHGRGTATAAATYGGDDNHTGSTDSKTFAIDKAASTTTVTCPATMIYSGLPLTPCTAAVTGPGGLNQSLSVTYTNNTDPGTGHASASFTGDGNHSGSSDTDTFVIGFNVCPLYDQTKAVKQNATAALKFFLCDAAGRDVSSSAIVVNAVSLTLTAGSLTGILEDSGNANPDNNFRFDPTLGPSGGYIFNLSTKPLGPAMWKLSFTVGGQTFGTYELGFGVR